ncbi:unnamed protein product [Paramecium octaurelia]|uniref:Uncharacterized protein n=1 Tax=Paramecium octaurelia TaxID=43137 RepID=A0A8S1VI92_PAROT|nr:unnamed protein product [Paramecium octaurelia]
MHLIFESTLNGIQYICYDNNIQFDQFIQGTLRIQCLSWILQILDQLIAKLLIGVIQFVIVEYGGSVMGTSDGLSLKQWFICAAIGMGSIVWRSIAILVVKPIMLKSGKGKLKVN